MEFINLKNKDKFRLVKDVLLHPLKVNKDNTGVLVETLRSDWKEIYGEGREFYMQYFSITPPAVARDENIWHFHVKQEDRFLVIQGEVIVAIADNRKDSETKGIINLFYMQSQIDPYILLIPREVLHGFMVVSKTDGILLNFPTQLYDPNDEIRVPYNEVLVKLDDGADFTWEKVRKVFKFNE